MYVDFKKSRGREPFVRVVRRRLRCPTSHGCARAFAFVTRDAMSRGATAMTTTTGVMTRRAHASGARVGAARRATRAMGARASAGGRETLVEDTKHARVTTIDVGYEGLALKVRTTTNAQGVHTVSVECDGTRAPQGLTLHWGVRRASTGAEWNVLPEELHPPGTNVYKNKAMRSAFPVWGPLNLVLDPGVESVPFALVLAKSGEWIKPSSGGDFEIALSSGRVNVPVAAAAKKTVATTPLAPIFVPEVKEVPAKVVPAKAADPVELLIADAAYAKWEQAGRPKLDTATRDNIMKTAAEDIKSKLRAGMSLNDITVELKNGSQSIAAPLESPPTPAPVFASKVVETKQQKTFSAAEFTAAADSRAKSDARMKWNKMYNESGFDIFVQARENSAGMLQLHVLADSEEDLIIHWATTNKTDGTWRSPPHGFSTQPSRSWGSSGNSWETELERMQNGLRAVTLDIPVKSDDGIIFVLRTPSNKWIKCGGEDFFASLEGSQLSIQRPAKKERKHREDKKHEHKQEQRAETTFKAPAVKQQAKRVAPITRERWNVDDIALDTGAFQNLGGHVAQDIVDMICDAEQGATRSLMHRYNAGADMLAAAHGKGEAGLVAMFCWFRFMALRQLVWNNDYNIKPREISVAQTRMTEGLSTIYRQDAEHRDVVRLIMATIGRGGAGDVGQRIRDEILAVQQKNNCKGGMMEEWHQKLHNNTSPDDVPICEALLKYIASDCDISVYWAHLHSNGITAERMAAYDRKICSEPKFSRDQYEGLAADLTEYLRTLKAVHSGADLDSAAEACLGYHQDACKGKEINIPPIHEVASERLEELLDAARELRSQDPLLALEAMLEARRYLWKWTRPNGKANDRIKDVIYLDLALESAARSVVEGSLESMSSRAPYDVLRISGLVLENLCMSASGNHELRICLKEWQNVLEAARRQGDWALQAKAVCDRLQNSLGEISQRYIDALQPTARNMGGKLGVDEHVLSLFSEEIIRGTAAAPLSQMLRALDPVIRNVANMGSWQIVSNAEAAGVVVQVASLAEVVNVKYAQPTVIVADRVGGEEDIPVGVVAVITPDMPDVLSHCAVRARNEKVLFATAFDMNIYDEIKAMAGKSVRLSPAAQGDDLQVSVIDGAVTSHGQKSTSQGSNVPSNVSIIKREFQGKFVAKSDEFRPELVGGKSRNLQLLRGRVSKSIKLPPSVALPFGTFDAIMNVPVNTAVKKQLESLVAQLEAYDSTDGSGFKALIGDVKACIGKLQPTAELSNTMKAAFEAESLAWPGDLLTTSQGQKAWQTILGVWASKYNERAVLSCKKASLKHADLSMAVLCQPVVRARYAFVLHTVNPQNNDDNEIYGELVCGLGEALVGNFAGRALAFKAAKNNLDNPTIVGYPSKSKGLFMEQDTLIFRSDSNGEDLEGFAGAGLYDSITMEEAKLKNVDYSTDTLITDEGMRQKMLSAIAKVALEIENLLGSAQDIEGAIAEDGTLWIVQTRPQV